MANYKYHGDILADSFKIKQSDGTYAEPGSSYSYTTTDESSITLDSTYTVNTYIEYTGDNDLDITYSSDTPNNIEIVIDVPAEIDVSVSGVSHISGISETAYRR